MSEEFMAKISQVEQDLLLLQEMLASSESGKGLSTLEEIEEKASLTYCIPILYHVYLMLVGRTVNEDMLEMTRKLDKQISNIQIHDHSFAKSLSSSRHINIDIAERFIKHALSK